MNEPLEKSSLASIIDDKVITIKIYGRFDFTLQKPFYKVLKKKYCTRKFIVNLKKTESIDSTAIGLLVALANFLENDKKRLYVVVGDSEVRKYIEMMHLDQIFTLV